MRNARLLIAALLLVSLTSCAGDEIKQYDKQLDDLDSQINEIEAKAERTAEDEKALDELYAERDAIQGKRDKKADEVNTGTSVGSAVLGGLGIIFGVPILVGIGGLVGRIKIPKRGKRKRKP